MTRARIASSAPFIAAACVTIVGCSPSLSRSAPAFWPQFRGPNCSGVSDADKPPVHFGPATNLLWKIQLPAGLSSPSVWNDRIFVTAVESNKLETICIRRRDGRILWRRLAPIETFEETTATSSPASATPATDGKRVYAYFGSFGALAYDFAGRELWRRALPAASLAYGGEARRQLWKAD